LKYTHPCSGKREKKERSKWTGKKERTREKERAYAERYKDKDFYKKPLGKIRKSILALKNKSRKVGRKQSWPLGAIK
jgi:hypothetical protein